MYMVAHTSNFYRQASKATYCASDIGEQTTKVVLLHGNAGSLDMEDEMEVYFYERACHKTMFLYKTDNDVFILCFAVFVLAGENAKGTSDHRQG